MISTVNKYSISNNPSIFKLYKITYKAYANHLGCEGFLVTSDIADVDWVFYCLLEGVLVGKNFNSLFRLLLLFRLTALASSAAGLRELFFSSFSIFFFSALYLSCSSICSWVSSMRSSKQLIASLISLIVSKSYDLKR